MRKKADMQDYIERAVGMINTYVPLDPEQMRHLLQDGRASSGPAEAGKSTIRLKDYFQDGDYLIFAYDPASKALLKERSYPLWEAPNIRVAGSGF